MGVSGAQAAGQTGCCLTTLSCLRLWNPANHPMHTTHGWTPPQLHRVASPALTPAPGLLYWFPTRPLTARELGGWRLCCLWPKTTNLVQTHHLPFPFQESHPHDYFNAKWRTHVSAFCCHMLGMPGHVPLLRRAGWHAPLASWKYKLYPCQGGPQLAKMWMPWLQTVQ